MSASKYFTHFRNKGEQSLYDSLVSECIEINGVNAIYVPRSGEINLLYGEDPRAKFSTWFEIVCYVASIEGFSGRPTLQAWGMVLEQTIKLQISKSAFTRVVGDKLSPNRPREGDLIVLPYGVSGNYLLEIKFVQDQVPVQQLGQEFLYDIDCRLFTYGNEEISTGLSEIDEIGDFLEQEIDIPIGTGTGTFLQGEVVYQGNSFVSSKFKAVVKEVGSNSISVTNMNGDFVPNQPLKGNTSGASRTATGGDQQEIKNDPRAQNKHIETIADPIFIRNPRNPFDRGNQ